MWLRIIKVCLFTITLSSLVVLLYQQTVTKLPHEDEYIFVERSRYFDWYSNRDFHRPEWSAHASYDVPKFAELYYGLVLRLTTGMPVAKYLARFPQYSQWSANGEYDHNWLVGYFNNFCCTLDDVSSENRALFQPIMVLRAGALPFAVGTLVLVYLIGAQLGGPLYGLVSMVVIGINGLFLSTTVTAMGDGILLFFDLSFIFVLIRWYDELWSSTKKSMLVASLLGVVMGLAIATKLNGIITTVMFVGTCVIVFFLELQPRKIIFQKLGLGIAIMAVTFYLLNPFVWQRPLLNTAFMIDHRAMVIAGQQQMFSSDALQSISDRLMFFYKKTLANDAEYATFKVDSGAFPLNPLLFVGGVITLKKLLAKKRRETILLVSWLILWSGATVAYLPLNWDRYYVPLMVSVTLVQSLAIAATVQCIFNYGAKTYFKFHKQNQQHKQRA